MSPMFQKFIKTVYKHYGTNIPRGLREEFRKGSLPLMKYTNFITFNSRAIMLCFAMLTGELWMYLIFELVVLMAIFIYMKHKHERLCSRLTKKIEELLKQLLLLHLKQQLKLLLKKLENYSMKE